jgi:hypothetical protein
MDHMVPHRLQQKPSNYTIPKPSNLRENPRPHITVSSDIMINVHFAKVTALYPCVVISSLVKRLENLLFATLYTSFGV